MTADVLGAPIKRVEDPRFITGKGRYLDDVQLTGTTHLAILRSPYVEDGVEIYDRRCVRLPGIGRVQIFL